MILTGRFSVGKGVLLPLDDGAKDICTKTGDTIEVEVLFDRDMIFHKKIFTMIAQLAKALGQTPDWLRAQLLVYTGLFNVLGTLDGHKVIAVSSMSKHSMRDDELHAFWDDAKVVIENTVLPKIQNEETREFLRQAVTAS